jgi:hypothetical protein
MMTREHSARRLSLQDTARKQSFRLVTIAIPDTKLVAMVKQSMTDSSSQQAGTDDANLIVFNFQGSGSILS